MFPTITTSAELAVSRPMARPRFYVAMAFAALIIEFVGFSHSRQQRIAAHFELSRAATLHATLFSVWIVLFVVQTALVATRHTRVHRRLGVIAAIVALMMVTLAPPLAVDFARRGVAKDPLTFLLVMLVDVLMFTVFVGAGLLFRRTPDAHKRFMLLATASLLPPGVSRWPIAVANPGPPIVIVLVLFLGLVAVYDRWTRGRMHPVTLWGGVALLASIPVRFAVAQTSAWHRVADWLIR